MSNVHYFPSPPVRPIEPPTHHARYHAEALMRLLVRDKSIPRERLHLLADLLDPVLAMMERTDV